MDSTGKIVVAIPVKNEQDFIERCLEAFRTQTRTPDFILLLLNNCTDRTLDLCQRMQKSMANIRIETCELAGALASAGEARRRVLNSAMELIGDGLILTTDADALPDQHWVAQNVAEIQAGADAVCGIPQIDEISAQSLPPRLVLDDKREKFLLNIIDEITTLVDPEPADPWPRHQQNSGASIALKAALLRRIGGAPHVPSGEDRALITRLRFIDARIRHAPHIKVSVSGRLEGRAAGGMADTIRQRMHKPDELLDEAIEPVADAYRRAMARAALRAARAGRHGIDHLARDLRINPASMRQAIDAPFFGAAWAAIQRRSPVLQKRRVRVTALAEETRHAIALLQQLKTAPQQSSIALIRNPRSMAENGLPMSSTPASSRPS